MRLSSSFLLKVGVSAMGILAYKVLLYANVLFSILISLILIIQFAYGMHLLNHDEAKKQTKVRSNIDKTNTDPKVYPIISVIIPAYREENILDNMFSKVVKLRYDKNRIQWIFALEPDDKLTISKLRELAEVIEEKDGLPIKISYKDRIIYIAYNESGLKTKPAALNEALKIAIGEVIGVYDAEDIPQEDHAEIAAEIFMNEKNVSIVQFSRIAAVNYGNWLERGQKVEFEIFREIYIKMSKKLGFAPILGSGYYIRRSVLEKIGGWHPLHPTEDIDLTYRILKFNNEYRIIIVDKPTITQAVPTLKQFVKQRLRWLKGEILSIPKTFSGGKKTLIVGLFTSIAALAGVIGSLWFFFSFLSNIVMFLTGYTKELPLIVSILANVPLILLLTTYSIILSKIISRRKNLTRKEMAFFYAMIAIEALISIVATFEAVFAPTKWHRTTHVPIIIKSLSEYGPKSIISNIIPRIFSSNITIPLY